MKILKSLLIAAGVMTLASCNQQRFDTSDEPADPSFYKLDNIMTRVSVRQFTDEPIARYELEDILKAGLQAPSAMNAQDWQVRIVTNQEMLNTLSGFMLKTEAGKGMAAPADKARPAAGTVDCYSIAAVAAADMPAVSSVLS